MNHNFQSDVPFINMFEEQTPISKCFHLNEHQQLQIREHHQNNVIKENDKVNTHAKIKPLYKQRMAILDQDMGLKNEEYNYIEYNKANRGKSTISREEQLKRNRESAKLSRNRKKEYVEMLQQKNAEKDKMIAQLSMKLKNSEDQRERLKQIDLSARKKFTQTISEQRNKLSEMIESSVYTDQEVEAYIQGLLKQFGVFGELRMATTNIYIKEVIELVLADIHKYIINCALNNKGLIGNGKWELIDEQIAFNLGVNKEKRIEFKEKYSQKLIVEANKLKELSLRLYETYQSIQIQGKVIQDVFNNIKKEFEPKRLGKTLVWFQQNKFKKEIKRLRAYWMDTTIDSAQIYNESKKQIKISQS